MEHVAQEGDEERGYEGRELGSPFPVESHDPGPQREGPGADRRGLREGAGRARQGDTQNGGAGVFGSATNLSILSLLDAGAFAGASEQ